MPLAILAESVTTYNESVIDKCTTGIVLAQDPSGTLIVEPDVYEHEDRQVRMRIHSRQKENRHLKSSCLFSFFTSLHHANPNLHDLMILPTILL